MLPPRVPRLRLGLALLTPMALLVFLLRPSRGFAADLVFSGALERLAHESISVRLGDRRVIDARLPNTPLLSSVKIAARYNMGDQVEITCKRIEPVFEEDTTHYQFLEVTKIRFLREPSREELSKMRELPSWRELLNLLNRPNAAPSTPNEGLADAPRTTANDMDATARAKLEHAREVNLNYIANMPNFVADETGKRYTGDSKSPQWRFLDTIETEIAFKGNRAIRERIRRDGRPWDRPFQALPGFKWSGGFGTEIKPIFDLQCPTTIDYEGRAELRGRKLLKFRFSSPADGCFGDFTVEYQRYDPARNGHVLIDDPADGMGGNVIQLDEEADGFPARFDFAHRTEQVSWDYVKIGDDFHLLPVAANFVVLYSSGSRFRVDVEYRNHRHFEASTNITFH
jgi:hypothetical protein